MREAAKCENTFYSRKPASTAAGEDWPAGDQHHFL